MKMHRSKLKKSPRLTYQTPQNKENTVSDYFANTRNQLMPVPPSILGQSLDKNAGQCALIPLIAQITQPAKMFANRLSEKTEPIPSLQSSFTHNADSAVKKQQVALQIPPTLQLVQNKTANRSKNRQKYGQTSIKSLTLEILNICEKAPRKFNVSQLVQLLIKSIPCGQQGIKARRNHFRNIQRRCNDIVNILAGVGILTKKGRYFSSIPYKTQISKNLTNMSQSSISQTQEDLLRSIELLSFQRSILKKKRLQIEIEKLEIQLLSECLETEIDQKQGTIQGPLIAIFPAFWPQSAYKIDQNDRYAVPIGENSEVMADLDLFEKISMLSNRKWIQSLRKLEKDAKLAQQLIDRQISSYNRHVSSFFSANNKARRSTSKINPKQEEFLETKKEFKSERIDQQQAYSPEYDQFYCQFKFQTPIFNQKSSHLLLGQPAKEKEAQNNSHQHTNEPPQFGFIDRFLKLE